jgi:hypothetical protein
VFVLHFVFVLGLELMFDGYCESMGAVEMVEEGGDSFKRKRSFDR